MKVVLLKHIPNPEDAVVLAARLCYSPASIEDLVGEFEASKKKKFIQKIISLGHYSVLEHANFTFGLEGISRTTSHQLVRHRIASYSQQSQRYVQEKGQFEYVVPPSISENTDLAETFEETMFKLQKLYGNFVQAGIPVEDARYVLPNAAKTKLIVTMNARELRHFFRLRCCNRAQWEIKDLATEMLTLVKKVAPNIFKDAGPECLVSSCPEGKMTCGRIDKVREKFRAIG